MIASINRTGHTIWLHPPGDWRHAFAVAEAEGYTVISVLDISNYQSIRWEGVEHSNLMVKDGVLYRFNEWNGVYPFEGIIIEEIGTVKEEQSA